MQTSDASLDPTTRLSEHVLKTLPEDPHEQKDLLNAIYFFVSHKHPAREPLAKALLNVHAVIRDREALKKNTEQAQLKFAQLRSGNTPAK